MKRNPAQDPHPALRDAVDVTRFWLLVNRREPEECWEWGGYIDDDGYGVFVWHGARVGAHALAVSFSTGEHRGDGLDTLHSCDNRSCVNPAHLRFGTRAENIADMDEKGRRKSAHVLTDSDVREIRERRANGARQKDLARQYGVSEGWVSGIINGTKRPEAGGPIVRKDSGNGK